MAEGKYRRYTHEDPDPYRDIPEPYRSMLASAFRLGQAWGLLHCWRTPDPDSYGEGWLAGKEFQLAEELYDYGQSKGLVGK